MWVGFPLLLVIDDLGVVEIVEVLLLDQLEVEFIPCHLF
jgi:hypothetical protein